MRTGSWAAKPKLLVSIFISIIAIAGSPMAVYAFAGNGAGSSADPYEITNCAQLQAVSNNLSASYELMNSIDCATQTGFMPISGSGSFTGTFDGNNYMIDNLTIDPAGNPDNVSLFGHLDGATIRDVKLNHAHITGGNAVGSIAGLASNSTTISDIKLLNGVIQGTNQVGGFVGSLGVIVYIHPGLDGDNSPVLEFSESKSTTVQGFSDTTTSEIGGAVGEGGGIIKYVSTEGSVSGNTFDNSMSDYVGGIAGGVGSGVTLSYSRAAVTGGTYVGGLVGYAYFGSFEYTYSSGDVTGGSNVGGIVGETDNVVSYSNFSDSIVTGGFPSGGIIGDISTRASFVSLMGDTVYDSVRSTQPNCVGYDERFDMPGDCLDIAGQSNYFFNNASTTPFDSWDFVNDWQVQTNDYPLLRVQPSAPTAVSVTPGLTSLQVSWDAPTDTQQAPITGYRLEYVKAGKTAMTVIPITDPAAHSYTITGLNTSTDYNLRLRAINQAGDGDVVSLTSSTILGGPSAPVVSPSGSSSDKSASTAQSQSTSLSFQNTQSLQGTGSENAATNELSSQASPTGTDASPKSSNAAIPLSTANTHKKSSSNAWWWLSVLPIAAGAWLWRKQKTKHP